MKQSGAMLVRLMILLVGSTLLGQQSQTKWPAPVNDTATHTYFLADLLEYRPRGASSDFRWDAEGWSGGDYNRLWFKSEGERNTAFKADYNADLQLLYGRLVSRYSDLQVGARVETQSYQGRNVSRAHAVIGFQSLIPYRYEFEPALFISQNGDASARLSFTRDHLLNQRWILQARLETNLAAQRVERFTTGSGLNNIELGARLRYEARREFAPYLGVSFDQSYFGTADLVRAQGGDSSQLRFVVGIRFWR